MTKEARNKKHELIYLVAVILLGSSVWAIALLNQPDSAPPLRAPDVPSQVTSTPLPKVQRTPAHSPSPKPTETKIYVQRIKVPSYWGLDAALADWSLADRYVDFVPVSGCPVLKPCLTVKMNKKLDDETAAVTTFMTDDYHVEITLNPVVTDIVEAQSTMCHETGHVLGLPHIKGTINTCMTSYGSFRTHPTALDTRLVNTYGVWNLGKMYELSGKDLDIRSLPK